MTVQYYKDCEVVTLQSLNAMATKTLMSHLISLLSRFEVIILYTNHVGVFWCCCEDRVGDDAQTTAQDTCTGALIPFEKLTMNSLFIACV